MNLFRWFLQHEWKGSGYVDGQSARPKPLSSQVLLCKQMPRRVRRRVCYWIDILRFLGRSWGDRCWVLGDGCWWIVMKGEWWNVRKWFSPISQRSLMGHIIIISILFVNSLLIKNLFTRQLVSSLVNLRYVHLLLCLLFTLSTSNLFTCQLVKLVNLLN